MRERRERGGGGRDGNCFCQRQWGAIRVIKLISRTNKEREREGWSEGEGQRDRFDDDKRSRSDTRRKQWNQLFLFSPCGGEEHTRATVELNWMEPKLLLLLTYLKLIYPSYSAALCDQFPLLCLYLLHISYQSSININIYTRAYVFFSFRDYTFHLVTFSQVKSEIHFL